jgi:hypothetical protein
MYNAINGSLKFKPPKSAAAATTPGHHNRRGASGRHGTTIAPFLLLLLLLSVVFEKCGCCVRAWRKQYGQRRWRELLRLWCWCCGG